MPAHIRPRHHHTGVRVVLGGRARRDTATTSPAAAPARSFARAPRPRCLYHPRRPGHRLPHRLGNGMADARCRGRHPPRRQFAYRRGYGRGRSGSCAGRARRPRDGRPGPDAHRLGRLPPASRPQPGPSRAPTSVGRGTRRSRWGYSCRAAHLRAGLRLRVSGHEILRWGAKLLPVP